MSLRLTAAQVEALPWQEVTSSNVRRLAWGGERPLAGDGGAASPSNVWIDFGTVEGPRVYRYANVPYGRYLACLEAKSVGGMVAKVIKGPKGAPLFAYDEVDIREDAEEQTGQDILDAITDMADSFATRLANIERGLSALLASVNALINNSSK